MKYHYLKGDYYRGIKRILNRDNLQVAFGYIAIVGFLLLMICTPFYGQVLAKVIGG